MAYRQNNTRNGTSNNPNLFEEDKDNDTVADAFLDQRAHQDQVETATTEQRAVDLTAEASEVRPEWVVDGDSTTQGTTDTGTISDPSAIQTGDQEQAAASGMGVTTDINSPLWREFSGKFGSKEGQSGWDVRFDIDGNNAVDFQDFLAMANQGKSRFNDFSASFGSKKGEPGFKAHFDFNADNVVDFQDFVRFNQGAEDVAPATDPDLAQTQQQQPAWMRHPMYGTEFTTEQGWAEWEQGQREQKSRKQAQERIDAGQGVDQDYELLGISKPAGQADLTPAMVEDPPPSTDRGIPQQPQPPQIAIPPQEQPVLPHPPQEQPPQEQPPQEQPPPPDAKPEQPADLEEPAAAGPVDEVLSQYRDQIISEVGDKEDVTEDDVWKVLGAERTGVEKKAQDLAEDLEFDTEKQIEDSDTEIDALFAEAQEATARRFAISPSGGRSGAAQRDTEFLERDKAIAKAQARQKIRSQAGAEQRANIETMDSLLTSREKRDIDQAYLKLAEDAQERGFDLDEARLTGVLNKAGPEAFREFTDTLGSSQGDENYDEKFDFDGDGIIDSKDMMEFTSAVENLQVDTLQGKQLRAEMADRSFQQTVTRAGLTGTFEGLQTVQEAQRLWQNRMTEAELFGGPPPVTYTEEEYLGAFNSKRGDINYRADFDLNDDGGIDFGDLKILTSRTEDLGGGIKMYTPPGRQTLAAQALGLDERKFVEASNQFNTGIEVRRAEFMQTVSGYQFSTNEDGSLELDDNGNPMQMTVQTGTDAYGNPTYGPATSLDREKFEEAKSQFDEHLEQAWNMFADELGFNKEKMEEAIRSGNFNALISGVSGLASAAIGTGKGLLGGLFSSGAGAGVGSGAGAGVGSGAGAAGAGAAAAAVGAAALAAAPFAIGALGVYHVVQGFRHDADKITYNGQTYDLGKGGQAKAYEAALIADHPTIARLSEEDGPLGSLHRNASSIPDEGLIKIFRGLEIRRRGTDQIDFGNSMFGQEWVRATSELQRRGINVEQIREDVHIERTRGAFESSGSRPAYNPDVSSMLRALEASGHSSSDATRLPVLTS